MYVASKSVLSPFCVLFQVGGRPSVRLVRVGRREMEVPETFQCYLTTAIGNPHLLPEVTTNVTESARACS